MIRKSISESIKVKNKLLQEESLQTIQKIGDRILSALKNRHKILIAGNGGSAADAQHFASEIINKFITKRKGLPAIALTTDSSIVTSIANDYGYENIFSRQIEALGKAGDIFFGISTSGDSENIIRAMKTARKKDLLNIGLLGRDGGEVRNLCDLALIVPSSSTPRIQEAHILVIHIICQIIDEYFK